MNTLNIDILYYIGTFLNYPTIFYYGIPHKKDLYKCFNDNDFNAYISFLIRHKCLKELIKIKKYTNLNISYVNYAIKHFDKRIFNFCLKNINNINYFDSFKCASYYNKPNAIKQLMKYENLCELKNPEIFLGFYSYNVKKYNDSCKNGCGINVDAFKYYLSNTMHKNILNQKVSLIFDNIRTILERKVKRFYEFSKILEKKIKYHLIFLRYVLIILDFYVLHIIL